MSSVVLTKKSSILAIKPKRPGSNPKLKKDAIFEPRGPADGEPGRREVERKESTRFQTATKFLKSLRPGAHQQDKDVDSEEGRLDRNSSHYQSEGKGIRAKRKSSGHKVGPAKETERSQSFHEKRRFSFNANSDGVSYDPKVMKLGDKMRVKDTKWPSPVDGIANDDPSGKENIPLQQLAVTLAPEKENIYENIASLATNTQKIVCLDSSTRGEPVGAETEVLNTLNLDRLEKDRRSFRKLTKDSGYETTYTESDYANLDAISQALDKKWPKSDISNSFEDLSSSEIYSVPNPVVETPVNPWANLSSTRSHRKYSSAVSSAKKNSKYSNKTDRVDKISSNNFANSLLGHDSAPSSLPVMTTSQDSSLQLITKESETGGQEVSRRESLRCYRSSDDSKLTDRGGLASKKGNNVTKKRQDQDISSRITSYPHSPHRSPTLADEKSDVTKHSMFNANGDKTGYWEEGEQLTDDEYVSHLRTSSYQLLQGRHHGNSVFQSHPYIAHVRQSSNQSNASEDGTFLCYSECFSNSGKSIQSSSPKQTSSMSPSGTPSLGSEVDNDRTTKTASPPLPPVRDASSLKYIKYGPGHEKYPSWPVSSDSSSQVLSEAIGTSLLSPGGSHRSKSWTEDTDYPKEKQPSYARPSPKKSPSFSQQLKTVTEASEKLVTEAKPTSFSTSLDAMYKPSHTYYPPYDKDGREFGDKDYQTPSPPERDCPSSYTFNFNDYAKRYGEVLDNYAYYDIPPPEKWAKENFPVTPFMDKLRRESSDPSNFWMKEEREKDVEKIPSKDSGRESVTTVVTNSSSNSSNETLKWHGSNSDLSVFSNHSRFDSDVKQSVAFSSRVQSPQKYHPESVTFHKLDRRHRKPYLTQLSVPSQLLGEENKVTSQSGESPTIDQTKQPSVQQRILELERLERQSKSVPNLCTVKELQVKKISDSQLSIDIKSDEMGHGGNPANGEPYPKHSLSVEGHMMRGDKTFTYYDPTKRHKVSDPTLKAIQKQALLSYYERQTGRVKGSHPPRESRLDPSRLKKRSSSLSRDSSVERDCSLFPEIAPKAGRALARLDKVIDMPLRGANSQLKRKNYSMTKSYSESEFSFDNVLGDNWREESKENLPRLLSTGNGRRDLSISTISSIHLTEHPSSNKNGVFLTSAVKTDPEGGYLTDPSRKDVPVSLSSIPPERPPKKPHLRGVSHSLKSRGSEESLSSATNDRKTAVRKPRAPDPPASPLVPRRPDAGMLASPEGSSRSSSPEFPPPPPPLQEVEIMTVDEPLPPPPTPGEVKRILNGDPLVNPDMSYHKDSYTVHRREKKFSLSREEKYRPTVNSNPAALDERLQERASIDNKVGRITERTLSASTLTPNSWEKYHNVRQQNTTTVFNSADSVKSSSMGGDSPQNSPCDTQEDMSVPCEWVLAHDTPCSPSSRSHTSSSFLSSLSSGSISPDHLLPCSPSQHEESSSAPSWRASLDSLLVPSVASSTRSSSSSSASSSLLDKYRRVESRSTVNLTDPSEIKGALQTLRSAYISRGLNVDLSIMTDKSAVSPPPIPVVAPPSYSICPSKDMTPKSSPTNSKVELKDVIPKSVTEVMTQTTPSVVKIGRQKCKEEIECEELGNDLARQLPQGHRLHALFVCDPSHKTSADYMEGIFTVEVNGDHIDNKDDRKTIEAISRSSSGIGSLDGNLVSFTKALDSTSSLPADSAYFTTSESKAKFMNRYINDISRDSMKDMGDSQQLGKKKEELVQRISKKLEILREESLSIKEEIELNEKLGADVTCRVEKLALPNEFEKFKLHVEEADKITSLLLALSGRLARAENALMNLPKESNNDEKKSLESKRDKLKEQLDEAKKLKESLDRRSNLVSNFLHKYLSTEEFADYDHFIKMKSKLIIDSREVDEKIKLGEEQMAALKETLASPRSS